MLSTSFNADWTVRVKVNPFLELMGSAVPPVSVTLPHDWLISQPRDAANKPGAPTAYYPDGVIQYTKKFEAPAGWRRGRVELAFDGVYRDAVITVNGSFVGQRASGYFPFSVRIDQYLRDGENTVRVECRNHLDARWYTGLGIYRDVHLHVGGPQHIAADGVRIRTVSASPDEAVIEVTTTVCNVDTALASGILSTEVLSPTGEALAADAVVVSARPSGEAVVRQRFHVREPALWGVDSPALHRLRSSLATAGGETDIVETSFGIRTLEWDSANGIRINGQSIKLRGGAVHHDNGVIGAATIDRAEERRIQLLKDAGYNAIRSAHNPISAAMLDACDRLGMLVMDEAFDMWTSAKTDNDYSIDFPTWWRADVTAMVERDFNHPSVIMYSIGNEIPETGDAWDLLTGRDIVDHIKALDPTRPTTNALNPVMTVMHDLVSMMGRSEESTGINTFMTDLQEQMKTLVTSELVTKRVDEPVSQVDIAGYNYAFARYEMDATAHPQRLFVGTESNPGQLDEIWSLVEAQPQTVGDFSWTGWEYLGEAGIGRTETDDAALFGDYPWRLSMTADLGITGHRRTISYWRQIVWGLRAEPYLAVNRPETFGVPLRESGWGWSDTVGSWSWPGADGKPTSIDVYSDADEVELLLNGTTIGRTPVGAAGKRCIASFEVTYAPGELTAIAYRDGVETGRSTLRSADTTVELQAVADRTEIRADDRDLAFVGITLTDGTGIAHVLETRTVTVSIEGPAVLQGLGSDDPKAENNYADASCSTFDGRALAVIRPTGPGKITVRIAADDGLTADVSIRAA